jgi:hypothetical protein
MSNPIHLPCDGCGQLAGPEHIARRLQRLEWATRFRPVHIQTLLLGGVPPQSDDEYIYTPSAPISGEALTILQAVQVSTEGKSREAILAEFQKLGLMLTHVLECPLAPSVSLSETSTLIQKHVPAALARIRRSLRPKRVFLISAHLQRLADQLHQVNLDCPVFPAPTGTFLPSLTPGEREFQAFRAALAGSYA